MAGVQRIYGATGLIGGLTGTLDNILSVNIQEGDLAIARYGDGTTQTNGDHVAENDSIYFYRYADNTPPVQDANGDVFPKIIKPDFVTDGVAHPNTGAGSAGRWYLITPSYFMEDLTVETGQKVVVNEIWSNDTDLTLSYNDGTVHVTLGATNTTFALPVTFAGQITSTVEGDRLGVTGNPPLVIDSDVLVGGLNAEFFNDEPIDSFSLLNDPTHTNRYAVLPRVETPASMSADTYPQDPDDMATKRYVDDELAQTPSDIDHNSLQNLDTPTTAGADFHPQYILADSSRNFDTTGYYPGVSHGVTNPTILTPPNRWSLTTKYYVDDEILSKATNVHIRKDGTVAFTSPPQVTNNGVNALIAPTQNWHLATLQYVNASRTTDHQSLNNRNNDDAAHTQYSLTSGTRPFVAAVIGITPTLDAHLATKGYVDTEIDQSILDFIYKDGSVLFTGIPGVANDTVTPSFGPIDDWDLTTKEYVDTQLSVGVDHDLTNGAANSVIHNKFPLLTGTRPFTNIQGGFAPTPLTDPAASNSLVTKGWVKTELTAPLGTNVISHAKLSGLAGDGHPQYSRADGTRPFTGQPTFEQTLGAPNFYPTNDFDIASVEFVRDTVNAGATDALQSYVNIYGQSPIISNQLYDPIITLDLFIDGRGSDLIDKQYIDQYIGKTLVSLTDTNPEFYADKVETNNALTTTSIYTGTDTGIVIDKTEQFLDGITRASIVNGGVNSFVYLTENVADGGTWANANDPQTYATVINTAGATVSITETHLYPQGTSDVDIRIEVVRGDVAYMDVLDAGTGLVDGIYDVLVSGDLPTENRATWSVTVVGGSVTAIVQVSPYTAGTNIGYTNVGTPDIVTLYSGAPAVQIRPYVVGEITKMDVVDPGTGYGTATAGTYNLTELTKGDVEFLGSVTGHGTADLLSMDITFINPKNEKVKYSHFISDISAVDALTTYGGVGYTRTTGNVISSLTFDTWGHITGITEEVTGGATWVVIDNTDSPYQSTANTNYFVDVSTAAVSFELPPTPTIGMTVIIDDYEKNSSVNNITVTNDSGDALGTTPIIEGVTADRVIDVDGSRVELTYVDGTYGWRYTVI